MNQEHDIEIHVDGGVYSGPVDCEFSIEDNSFDHEFGTQEEISVVLDEVDCDNILFFPESDDSGEGQKSTPAQVAQAEEIILSDPEKYINFPHHYDIAEYHSGF